VKSRRRGGRASFAVVAGPLSTRGSDGPAPWSGLLGAPAVAGFVGSALAAPLVGRLARSLGLLDRPGPLKPHAGPVPYLGGLAVAAGLVASTAVLPAAARPGLVRRFPPLVAALVLGTADDAVGLPVSLRVVGEMGVGALLARATLRGGTRRPGAGLARVLLTAVAANALNLVDGADGLAAGTALLGALGEVALLVGPRAEDSTRPAPTGAAPRGLAPSGPPTAALALAAALAGAAAGFLWWNRPPARLYLGDGGAYLLGTALALMASEAAAGAAPAEPAPAARVSTAPAPAARVSTAPAPAARVSTAPAPAEPPTRSAAKGAGWPVALLPLAYPLAELAFAVIRRVRGGVAPWTGDRSHLYDRLAARGWPAPVPVASCLALQAGAVALALGAARQTGREGSWWRVGLAAGGLGLAGQLGGALRLDP